MSRNLLFGITSRLLMFVAAALTLLSVISFVVNPAEFWLVSILGLCFMPLTLLNCFLLLWAIKRRSKSFVIPLVALLPTIYFMGLYVRIPFSKGKSEVVTEAPAEKKGPVKRKQKVEGPRSLKVITYNVGRFMLASGEDSLYTRKECMDSIFRFVACQEPDIICFQEFYLRHGQSVRSSLPKQLRNYKAEYYFFTTSYGLCGNLTLSRMKAVGKGKVKFDESANLALYTDYEAFDRKFRVYNCHFESYNISFPGIMRSLTKSETDIFSETGEKMKRSITMRPSQVAQVLSDIEACPIESFVCGDFNDNPVSYTYYRMTRGRRDAFVDAGHGFGATYSMLWPMLRIDYVLYPDCYRAVSYEVPRIGLSDHYPVITEISI